MRKLILKKVLRISAPMFLMVTSADILYLYYAGGWYDPIRAIEVAEIILLYLLVCLGLVCFLMEVFEKKGAEWGGNKSTD